MWLEPQKNQPAGDEQNQPNRRVEVWEPGPYARIVPKLFEHIRTKLGDDVELLHDIHERLPPILAIQLVKDVEKFKPYFMEDPFSPEDVGYFKIGGHRACIDAGSQRASRPNLHSLKTILLS